jgi:hypothetical protein
MIGSLLLSDALTSKFFSDLFLGKLHVRLMLMCFPSNSTFSISGIHVEWDRSDLMLITSEM